MFPFIQFSKIIINYELSLIMRKFVEKIHQLSIHSFKISRTLCQCATDVHRNPRIRDINRVQTFKLKSSFPEILEERKHMSVAVFCKIWRAKKSSERS